MVLTPLKDWENIRRTYRFGVKTFYNDFHIGVDYIVPVGTPIYAWTDCEVRAGYGSQGGHTAYIYADGMMFRCLHLHKKPKEGQFGKGSIIAHTGNTGLSTAPHLHLDVSKNGKLELNNRSNFIDPDKYFKNLMEEHIKKLEEEKIKLENRVSDLEIEVREYKESNQYYSRLLKESEEKQHVTQKTLTSVQRALQQCLDAEQMSLGQIIKLLIRKILKK